MATEVLRLGPFKGGMNIASDPTLIQDDELILCLNLELDIDGALGNRPPIQITAEGATNPRMLIFGSISFSGILYLFATQSGKTFISSDEGDTWTELAPGGSRECKTMEVYNNTVWLPATQASANGGISWTPGGGAVSVAAMPRAEKCIVHKNRLYLCPGESATTNASRLSFSQAADFTTWPGASFIDIQPGDGDTLNNVIVYQDNLLIFKGQSTHALAYDLDPADAILREVSSVVGSHGSFGVTQYENTVFCMYRNKVYEVINYNFNLLNIKVDFVKDNSLPTGTSARYEDQHLTLLGERLVVRYYNKTYVFNLRTRTWSEWQKTDTTSTIEWHIFGPLIKGHSAVSSGQDSFYTSYSFDVTSGGYKIIKINDGVASGAVEGLGTHKFYCVATTKDYDMADPVRYKKLFWWGVDVTTGNQVTGSIIPITFISQTTWDILATKTWDEVLTWDNPIGAGITTSEVVAGDSIINTNKMIKFGKAMRFRKINFSLQLETDGSLNEPTKVFQYVAVVGVKQLVSARIT